MVRTYYQLAKPGIVYGNALTAGAAYLLGTEGFPDALAFLGFLLGMSFSIAGSCVFNNIMERDVDALMARTKKRALVTGAVSVRDAALYGGVLTAVGLVLLLYVSLWAFLLTVIGIITYVAVYTPSKRRTRHSTAIGSVAGAVPPVAGYAAASGGLDLVALLLFLVLAAWQMAHFFAIALNRQKEYAAAGMPVMPLAVGVSRTRAYTALYAVLFATLAIALGFVARAGATYFIVMSAVSAGWLLLAIAGFYAKNTGRWARRMFLYSLIALLAFSLAIALA
jgi:protoheme IX farnesyltransferase